jgi:hypothetical protein
MLETECCFDQTDVYCYLLIQSVKIVSTRWYYRLSDRDRPDFVLPAIPVAMAIWVLGGYRQESRTWM